MTAPRARPVSLTRREREVLVELCRPGASDETFSEPSSTRHIASALFITEAAVKQHLLRLYDKFGIHEGRDSRRRRLANTAISEGIVTERNLGSPDPGSVMAPPAMDGRGASDPVSLGYAALRRRAWREAFETLNTCDKCGELSSAEDFCALGEAAIWAGEPDVSSDARQRAYEAYANAGNDRRAAVTALALVVNFALRLKFSIAAGWLAKAQRHLEPHPVGREHALLAATLGLVQVMSGDFEHGFSTTHQAMELGRAHGDRDATMLGQVFHADVLVRRKQIEQAAILFDEAMASATAGELGPLATGLVYCRTICSCIGTFDFKRALEWTEAIEKSRVAFGEGGFPGDCRVHRASILAIRGEWQRAEQEARVACAESEVFDLTHTGIAHYEIGELRLRAGDFEAAEQAFDRAAALGIVPEPGRAQLLMARGRIDDALASLSNSFDDAKSDPLGRARLRPTEIEAALLAGNLERARMALADLQVIAEDYQSPSLRATVTHVRACVALAEGSAEAAIADLRSAFRQFIGTDMPYFAARARLDLGRALAAGRAFDAALAELRGAEQALRRLGAVMDADRGAELIGSVTTLRASLTSK